MIIDKINILGLYIKKSNCDKIMKEMSENIDRNKLFTFHNINIYIANLAFKDNSLKESLSQMSKLYSDGIGIFLASKLLYLWDGLEDRINGTDLYYKILGKAEINKWSLSFFGGSDESVLILKQKLLQKYPLLKINNIVSRNNSMTNDEIIEKLNRYKSDILMIGLGTPKQEIWLTENCKKIKIPVQFCVGSGIDFLSGNLKRAPLWMRKIGLEWLFRLFQEPKRLWKRYILGIPLFIFYVLRQKVKLVLNKTEE